MFALIPLPLIEIHNYEIWFFLCLQVYWFNLQNVLSCCLIQLKATAQLGLKWQTLKGGAFFFSFFVGYGKKPIDISPLSRLYDNWIDCYSVEFKARVWDIYISYKLIGLNIYNIYIHIFIKMCSICAYVYMCI